MIIEPKIEYRKEQPYAAIKAEVRREEIPALLPLLIPEVFSWLKNKKIDADGAPFFNYVKMDNGLLEVEVGVPVNHSVGGDERVIAGLFPAGNYAVVTYAGNYSNLFKVHLELEKWKEKNGINFQLPKTEFYPTDPGTEPNPEKWITVIAVKIADKEYFKS
jgi:effector-binding domain-containing protein